MRIVAYPRDPAPQHLELQVPDHWHDSTDGSELGLWPEKGESSLFLSFRPHQFGERLMPYLMGEAKRVLSDAPAKLGLGPVFGHGAMFLRVPPGYELPPVDRTGVPWPDVVVLLKAQAIGNGRFHQLSYILHRKSVVMATFLCNEHLWARPLDEAMQILSSIEIKRSVQ